MTDLELIEKWQIISEKDLSAQENMEADQRRLLDIGPGKRPILNFYEWKKPTVTYGCFVNPSDYLKLDQLEKRGIELAKRPSGGGIIFHLWDVAFSVVLPSDHPLYTEETLKNYEGINRAVKEAVERTADFIAPNLLEGDPSGRFETERFCMAKPTIYDVMLNGAKIAGAAQRKKKNGLLHQGTISCFLPDWKLLEAVLVHPKPVIGAMKNFTFSFQSERCEEIVKKLKGNLQKTLTQ
ncbi:MAG: Octanoyltransferase LipM [Chlamydiia bacterium]|nr:Octanoyltransferase LipM [Chlamydiia bacterium]